jgi:hypothetical protein
VRGEHSVGQRQEITRRATLRPPYTTYECLVYRIVDGKVASSTAYINWLDPYVQVGLDDLGGLTS